HLCLLDKPLYSINFTWGRRPLSQIVTKHDVIKLLEKMKKGRPLTAHDSLDWPTRLNAEIAKFALLPEDIELRLKRDMKLHPLANLLYQEKDELGRRIKRQTSNHTPLLVLTENKPPKLGHLKSYDPDNPKRYRPKKISDERITPYLPVFRIEKEQS
ncbi:MAG: DNA replication terminus site-binding protein, partial [Pseudomonadales bacterium]|nr:DNA replication terminus site-binding protein [Pseudomonadales bacterium]